ncbi:MAG: LTA synthase family protein [Myxococcota bacterium]
MSDAKRIAPRPTLASLAVLAPLLGVAWLQRALLVSSHESGGHDLRGAVSDLFVAALAVPALRAAERAPRGRALGMVVLALWGALHYANVEHVRALAGALGAANAGLALHPSVLFGSLLHPTAPVTLVLLVVTGPAIRHYTRRHDGPLPWRQLSMVASALALVLLLWPIRPDAASWRQAHVLGLLARVEPSPAAHTNAHWETRADLSGASRITMKERPNVLLVVLEGVSGGYLSSLAERAGVEARPAMPRLDAIARDGLTFANFVAHQRQTDRGEYSILCGALPRLVRGTTKMTSLPGADPSGCLPEVLRDAGYRTVYLQSAPLSFMLKDRFMPWAGFQRVLGDQFFARPYARNNWGVDDRSFFGAATDLVAELNAGSQPWFATLLTSGTHHPYLVPDNAAPGGDPRHRAVAFLDDSVAEFIGALRRRGVLDDTLVLITSDESAGLDGELPEAQQLLSANWGLMIALVPGAEAAVVEEVYGQRDVALSVVDALGVDPAASQFSGRSMFRRYDTPRGIAFANSYAGRAYAWLPAGTVLTCDAGVNSCRALAAPHGPFGALGEGAVASPGQRDLVRAAIAAAERRRGPTLLDVEVPLLGAADDVGLLRPKGHQLLVGGQYLQLSPGARAVVDLDFELLGADALADFNLDVRGGVGASPVAVLWDPGLGAVRSGGRLRVHAEYTAPASVRRFEVRLFAARLSDATASVRFHDAKLALQRSASTPAGLGEASVDVARPSDRDQYTLDSDPSFAVAPCMTTSREQAIGVGCGPGEVVYGPYVFASHGALARARFSVSTGAVAGRLEIDWSAKRGALVLGESRSQTVAAHQTVTLEAELTLKRSVVDLEARLRWLPDEDAGDVTVGAAELVITQPNTRG